MMTRRRVLGLGGGAAFVPLSFADAAHLFPRGQPPTETISCRSEPLTLALLYTEIKLTLEDTTP